MRAEWLFVALGLGFVAASEIAVASFVDANGHYSVRGETRTAPGMAKDRGMFSAVEQSFRLLGEVRASDKSSFFLELDLFKDPRKAYLGDTSLPSRCSSRRQAGEADFSGSDDACEGRHQDTSAPGYKTVEPRVSQAYIRHAFEYCILEAGRRGRDWGMGIFLDSGRQPFAQRKSVYDGITCDVNMQKQKNIGFALGFDKLAETGAAVDNPYDRPIADSGLEAEYAADGTKYGPSNSHDDLDQYFFSVEVDDRNEGQGGSLGKHVGLYFAHVVSANREKGGSDTDLRFLDLYAGFFFPSLTIQNEILFRLGKTADPNTFFLGGGRGETNSMQSIGFAGSFAYTVASSGLYVGPREFGRGDAQRHQLVFDYVYAPGESQGYYADRPGAADLEVTGEAARSSRTRAIAFHDNFKPALILFNAHPSEDNLRVDGVFDPSRAMNVKMFGLAYRYEDLQNGDFEAKLISAQLDKGMPSEVKAYYEEEGGKEGDRPIGFYGTDLGMELDLSYNYRLTDTGALLGVDVGYLKPGNAWRVSENIGPAQNIMLRSHLTFPL